jgi:hypothetical protein
MRMLLLLALISCRLGWAQEAPSKLPRDRAMLPGTLVFQVGFASALGEVGLAYTHRISNVFALEGGLGYGWTGAQLSLMPKLVFGSDHDRFVTGVGLSLSVPGAELSRGGRQPVVWVNFDALGYEHHGWGGFVFSVAVGTTTSLVHGITEAVDENNAGSVQLFGYTLPQFRIGLGFSGP